MGEMVGGERERMCAERERGGWGGLCVFKF